MKFLIFLTLVIAVATVKDINAKPFLGEKNIVPAQENEFPFMVSLASAPANDKCDHYCGGTLISRKHILTAKHCLVDVRSGRPRKDISNIRVIVGSNDMTRGRKLGILTWKTYEDWALENNIRDRIADDLYHDVAIATLSEEVRNITPATIARSKHYHLHGKDAVTLGWGHGNDGVNSQFLQKATLHVIPEKNSIKNFMKTDTRLSTGINHLSTMHKPPIAFGDGDSGGPLLVNGTRLIGINSAVCAVDINHPNMHNIHPSVEYYREFIESYAERIN